uniref:Uncharacterized protein n=1 Tax=Ditylenchus dipsaci TaxID=166011 RepID=A0A915DW19_9BILA
MHHHRKLIGYSRERVEPLLFSSFLHHLRLHQWPLIFLLLSVDLRTSDFKETTSSGLAASLASWLNLLSGMTMAIFLILLVFLLLFLSALHIPLPSEICDRKKIQMFEFVLRLSNEYLVGYFWKTLP